MFGVCALLLARPPHRPPHTSFKTKSPLNKTTTNLSNKTRINTLLEEAENERMHLLTFMAMRDPGPLFRAMVLAAQGVSFNLMFISYLISPKVCACPARAPFCAFLTRHPTPTPPRPHAPTPHPAPPPAPHPKPTVLPQLRRISRGGGR